MHCKCIEFISREYISFEGETFSSYYARLSKTMELGSQDFSSVFVPKSDEIDYLAMDYKYYNGVASSVAEPVNFFFMYRFLFWFKFQFIEY